MTAIPSRGPNVTATVPFARHRLHGIQQQPGDRGPQKLRVSRDKDLVAFNFHPDSVVDQIMFDHRNASIASKCLRPTTAEEFVAMAPPEKFQTIRGILRSVTSSARRDPYATPV